MSHWMGLYGKGGFCWEHEDLVTRAQRSRHTLARSLRPWRQIRRRTGHGQQGIRLRRSSLQRRRRYRRGRPRSAPAHARGLPPRSSALLVAAFPNFRRFVVGCRRVQLHRAQTSDAMAGSGLRRRSACLRHRGCRKSAPDRLHARRRTGPASDLVDGRALRVRLGALGWLHRPHLHLHRYVRPHTTPGNRTLARPTIGSNGLRCIIPSSRMATRMARGEAAAW